MANQPSGKSIENAITSAVATLGTAIDTKLTACMSALDNKFDMLKDQIQSKINERVEAAIAKNLECLNASDDTRQRVMENDIDRAVSLRLANAMDPKLAALRTDIMNEIKLMSPVNTDAISSCVESVAKVEAFNDRAERQQRRANLVLRNIPASFDNNNADLRPLIVQIGSKCGFELKATDILRAARFKSTKHKICPVIVKFESSDTRDRFFSYYFKNLSRFQLGALGFGESTSRVDFNEHLTDRNMSLFNLATQMKAESNIAKVSTFNGLVFVCLTGQPKGTAIHSVAELNTLIKKKDSSN